MPYPGDDGAAWIEHLLRIREQHGLNKMLRGGIGIGIATRHGNGM